jgi:hypothetical protein
MRFAENNGVVVMDFRRCCVPELLEIYQDFGLLCARETVRWALLKTADEDAQAHYALLDILKTITLIAQVPLLLRLAMVATSGAIEQVGRDMREELRELGCEAQVFRTEREATSWLRASATPSVIEQRVSGRDLQSSLV